MFDGDAEFPTVGPSCWVDQGQLRRADRVNTRIRPPFKGGPVATGPLMPGCRILSFCGITGHCFTASGAYVQLGGTWSALRSGFLPGRQNYQGRPSECRRLGDRNACPAKNAKFANAREIRNPC